MNDCFYKYTFKYTAGMNACSVSSEYTVKYKDKATINCIVVSPTLNEDFTPLFKISYLIWMHSLAVLCFSTFPVFFFQRDLHTK